MSIRTILIDDHRLFNDGLSLILRASTDFTVIGQVYDSRLALDTCTRLKPDLVLVDYKMPHLDGVAVVEQLHQLPISCRVVIVSLYADQREIARFNALNIDGYIAKTVTADRLLLLLRRIMAGEPIIETDSSTGPSLSTTVVAPVPYGLTKREIDILQRIRQGLTSEQIADELGLSCTTVQTHRKNILHKIPSDISEALRDFPDTLS